MAELCDGVSAADVLACLRQQACALEHLVALSSDKTVVPRGKEGESAGASDPELEGAARPTSAIDHKWDTKLAKQPMVVETNVTIMSLEGIDTATHTFSANVAAEFRVWYAGDVHDWDPKIRCTNLKEASTEPIESQYKCSDGSYCFKRQWHGVFVEHLELANFPMDIQDLSIEFVSDWPAEKVKFLKCRTQGSRMIKNDVTRDAWAPTVIPLKSAECRHHSKVAIRAREDITEGSGMHSDVMYPTIAFTLQLRRHSRNYMWNIILPTATLVSLAFTSFYVPLNEVADRASITLTILLSIIAYKLIIKDELPKVNFLTLIDKYILACMAIVAMISFANAAIGSGVETVTNDLIRQDQTCKIILATTWVMCNFAFGLRIVCRQYWARRRQIGFRRQCGDHRDRSSDVLLLV